MCELGGVCERLRADAGAGVGGMKGIFMALNPLHTSHTVHTTQGMIEGR